jgi:hypothetical protein
MNNVSPILSNNTEARTVLTTVCSKASPSWSSQAMHSRELDEKDKSRRKDSVYTPGLINV